MILYVYMSTTGLCKKTALAGFEDERRDGGFLQMDMGKKMDCSLEETEGPQYCRLNFKQLRTTFLVGCVVGSLEILENESALFYAKVCVVLYLLQGANIY